MINPDFKSISDKVLDVYASKMGENDLSFFRRVYAAGPEAYLQRLKAIDFLGMGKVLDAGCGFGQWSACLAANGNVVHGVEVSQLRADVTDAVLKLAGNEGRAIKGRLEALPEEDSFFDGIFCYGVLFSTDWKQSIKEFNRVLKPGGRLYFSATNGLGNVLDLWLKSPNKTDDYDPRFIAAQAFMNTVLYERDGTVPTIGKIIAGIDEMITELEGAGFSVISHGADGTINFYPGEASPKPFFKGEYYGFPGCQEIVAEKIRD